MWERHTFAASSALSARQRRAQDHARRVGFRAAVHVAADALFRFTHCRTQGRALWSDSTCAWLGSATFVHWAMEAGHIDIPRIVAETDGAPDTAEELHAAVRIELMVYWADRLASLPSKSTPGWLPLP